MLRRLAERAVGGQVPLGRARAAEIWRLANEPEGGVIELGGGLEAHAEHGHVRFTLGPRAEPAEGRPGGARASAASDRWEVRAELESRRAAGRAARTWRSSTPRRSDARSGEGLAARATGCGRWASTGTKSLQDLFTDRKVPSSLRHALPVVEAGERIAWIAGVAVSEEFAAKPGAAESAVLRASQAGP